MTRPMVWVMAVLLMAGTVFAYAPSASACSEALFFTVTTNHLEAGNFNAPDSQLAQAFRTWANDETAEIQVLGVYVYETIHAVDAQGDWSRGSVSVPVEMWGQWPGDTSPSAISPEDRSGEPPSTCGWGRSGLVLGTRSYSIVANEQFIDVRIDDASDDVLTAAFGAPAIADRDLSIEQDLIAQVDAARSSSTALFVGVGVAAIAAAAAVMYVARRNGAGAGVESATS